MQSSPSPGQPRDVLQALRERYPEARCELDFTTPLDLLMATVLSAQSTDRRANAVTPQLFRAYPTVAAYAASDLADLEGIISSTGLFRQKAMSLRGIGQVLCERFGGQVPATMDDLMSLPGVGRKTASVVLAEGFGVPALSVDTHVIRLAQRLGWTSQSDPAAIERVLADLFPPSSWIALSHVIIWHGRRCCHARRPACGACPVALLCPSFGIGPTDPAIAAGLVTTLGPR